MTEKLNIANVCSTRQTEGQQVTAPKKNGGGSANINSCTFNKHGAFRQFCASNPPLLLAANRYSQLKKKIEN